MLLRDKDRLTLHRDVNKLRLLCVYERVGENGREEGGSTVFEHAADPRTVGSFKFRSSVFTLSRRRLMDTDKFSRSQFFFSLSRAIKEEKNLRFYVKLF